MGMFTENVIKFRRMLQANRGGTTEAYPDIGVDTQDAKLAAGEGVVNREGMSLLGVDNLNMLNEAGLAMRAQGIDPNPMPVGFAPGSDGTDGLNSMGPGPRVPQGATGAVLDMRDGGMVTLNTGGYFQDGGNVLHNIGQGLDTASQKFLGMGAQDLISEATRGAERQRAELLGGPYLQAYQADQTREAAAQRGRGRPANIRWRDPDTGEEKIQLGRAQTGEDGTVDYFLQDPIDNQWKPASEVAGTTDIQLTGRGDQPPIEEGAGGIPNANSVSKGGIPSFDFKRESEAKAYGYAYRAIPAHQNLVQLEDEIPLDKLSSLYAGLAQWAQQNSNSKITAAILNKRLSEAGLQEYRREMTKFLQAVLRTDTGAAYTGTEIADYLSAFGIAPGTVLNPTTLRQFQSGRYNEIAAITSRAGVAQPYLAGLLEGQYHISNPFEYGQADDTDAKAEETTEERKWEWE